MVGVVKALVRPSIWDDAHRAVLRRCCRCAWPTSEYVIRTAPAERDRVLKAAVAALKKADPHRIVLHKNIWDDMRHDFFQDDRAMAGLLVGVCVALLVVTALGIVGLGSFWVAQRRRQIGVRRALGATRGNILHYFQTENFLLATLGIALGMVLAYGINLFLMQHYELPRMPAIYFPVGALALWLIGQVAVLGPALACRGGAAGGGDAVGVIEHRPARSERRASMATHWRDANVRLLPRPGLAQPQAQQGAHRADGAGDRRGHRRQHDHADRDAPAVRRSAARAQRADLLSAGGSVARRRMRQHEPWT